MLVDVWQKRKSCTQKPCRQRSGGGTVTRICRAARCRSQSHLLSGLQRRLGARSGWRRAAGFGASSSLRPSPCTRTTTTGAARWEASAAARAPTTPPRAAACPVLAAAARSTRRPRRWVLRPAPAASPASRARPQVRQQCLHMPCTAAQARCCWGWAGGRVTEMQLRPTGHSRCPAPAPCPTACRQPTGLLPARQPVAAAQPNQKVQVGAGRRRCRGGRQPAAGACCCAWSRCACSR